MRKSLPYLIIAVLLALCIALSIAFVTIGKSSYQIALEHGFVGSEQDWLASLRGEKGEKGDTGAQGIQGEKGEKGDTGAQGIQGEKGEKGDTGAQGVQGEKGEKGDTGAQGIQGEKGEKGDTGAQGVQGEKGEKGDTGAQGIQGEKGEKGDTGANGKDGTSWYSGQGIPEGTLGNIGDYYLDFVSGNLYQKAESGWATQGQFLQNESQRGESIVLTFDADQGTLPEGFESEYTIEKGSNVDLPIPEREGYEFLGWYYGEGVNEGQANSLTNFYYSVTLKAKWNKLYSLTVTPTQSTIHIGGFNFEGSYSGTEAVIFSLYLEKDGKESRLDEGDVLEISTEGGAVVFHGFLRLTAMGEYRLRIVAEEAGARTEQVILITVTA